MTEENGIQKVDIGKEPTLTVEVKATQLPKDPTKQLVSVEITSPAKKDPRSISVFLPAAWTPPSRFVTTDIADLDAANLARPSTTLRETRTGHAWQVKPRTVQWAELGDAKDNACEFELTHTISGRAPAPAVWTLRAHFQVTAPAGRSPLKVSVQVIGAAGDKDSHTFDLGTPKAQEDLPVTFYVSDSYRGRPLTALYHGERVTLAWKLKEKDIVAGSAKLIGPLGNGLGQRTLGAAEYKSGSEPVVAISPLQEYVLQAKVKGETEPRTVSIRLGVQTPQSIATVRLWPKTVFPGGPIACYWAVCNAALRLEIESATNQGEQLPRLPERAASAEKIQEEAQGTFKIKWGPVADRWLVQGHGNRAPSVLTGEGDLGDTQAGAGEAKAAVQAPPRWYAAMAAGTGDDVGAVMPVHFDDLDARREKDPVLEPVRDALAGWAEAKISDDFGEPVKPPEIIGFTAGAYASTKTALDQWVAVATRKQIEIHVRSGNKHRRLRVTGPEILGIGAVNDAGAPACQRLVIACRGKAETVMIREISWGHARPEQPEDLTIKDGGIVSADRLRIVVVGKRVYVLGLGYALSYVRSFVTTASGKTDDTKFDLEPRLARVATPEWEVVGIPYGRAEAAASPGYLFALAKTSGALVRFDVLKDAAVTAKGGSLTPPRALASANDAVAPLDMLQLAQAGVKDYLDASSGAYVRAARSEAPRSKLKPAHAEAEQVEAGSKVKIVKANAIDEKSVLLAVGGALLARSEVPDRKVKGLIQDRAYDPRRDVWVKCGHPFAYVAPLEKDAKGVYRASKKGSRYAWKPIEPGAHFCAAGRALHCREPTGGIWSIEGALLHMLGFRDADLTPIDAAHLQEPVKWHVARLYAGQCLLAGHTLRSPAGAELRVEAKKISLHDRDGAEQWAVDMDAPIERLELENTGNLVAFGASGARVWVAAKDRRTSGSALSKALEKGRHALVITGASASDVNLEIFRLPSDEAPDGKVVWHARLVARPEEGCSCRQCLLATSHKTERYWSSEGSRTVTDFDDLEDVNPVPRSVTGIVCQFPNMEGYRPKGLKVEYSSHVPGQKGEAVHGELLEADSWYFQSTEHKLDPDEELSRFSVFYDRQEKVVRYAELARRGKPAIALGRLPSVTQDVEWRSFTGNFRTFFGTTEGDALNGLGMRSHGGEPRRYYEHHQWLPEVAWSGGAPWDEWAEVWWLPTVHTKRVTIYYGVRLIGIKLTYDVSRGAGDVSVIEEVHSLHGQQTAECVVIEIGKDEWIEEVAGYMPNHEWGRRRHEKHWLAFRKRGGSWVVAGSKAVCPERFGGSGGGEVKDPTFHARGEIIAYKGFSGLELDRLGFHSRTPILKYEKRDG